MSKRKAITGLAYLATPYTNYFLGRKPAFHAACGLAAQLLKRGVNVYSPIVHSHPIAQRGRLQKRRKGKRYVSDSSP